MIKEVHLFGIGIFSGLILAVLFDFLRAFRHRFPHKNRWVAAEDMAYWMFAGFFLFYLFEKYNKGVLRFYIFLGSGLGVLFYCLFFQKPIFFCFSLLFRMWRYIFLFCGKIVGMFRKIVKKTLILPLKNAIKKITIMLHHT